MNLTTSSAGNSPTDAPPDVSKRPWTIARIRRGLAWRIGRAITSIRDAIFLPIATSSGFAASTFYALVSRSFDREHRGVASGRRLYQQLAVISSHHHYQLRRNIHRLEKGLVMQPRRPSFAANYIEETVRVYAELAELQRREPAAVDQREMEWAHDVLRTYFGVVKPEGPIGRAFDRWAETSPSVVATNRTPYARDLSQPPPVTYEQLHALAVRRRSVRWYEDRPVPRELIDHALEVAALSPSACNRQPFDFRIFDDADLRRRVLSVPLGTGGFGHQIPAVAVVVGRLRAFATERDRHLIYVDGGLAAMSFVLALEALGLSSVCINWADLWPQERAMAAILNLEADERVVMLIGFGYPDPAGMVPYSQKKPLPLFRRYNA